MLGRNCTQNCDEAYHFGYSDSIILYFETNFYSHNWVNVKELNDSIYKFRFEYGLFGKGTNQAIKEGRLSAEFFNNLPELPDTFELSGLNAKGLYWKDIYLNGISVGYDNVPLEKKELFDNCLKSIKMKIRKRKHN
jgi:hypothetical protein